LAHRTSSHFLTSRVSNLIMMPPSKLLNLQCDRGVGGPVMPHSLSASSGFSQRHAAGELGNPGQCPRASSE
jgi:hypothetical protein